MYVTTSYVRDVHDDQLTYNFFFFLHEQIMLKLITSGLKWLSRTRCDRSATLVKPGPVIYRLTEMENIDFRTWRYFNDEELNP